MDDLKKRALEKIARDIFQLEKAYGVAYSDSLAELKKLRPSVSIPSSIFSNSCLSSLEAVVKYLREDSGLSYKAIAAILGRSYDCVAITYRNARGKMPSGLSVKPSVMIPASVIRQGKLSVLESICTYLREQSGARYSEIARLLNRDDRTIWTVCKRAARKNEGK